MKLYAVRHQDDKQAVGLFWTTEEELPFAIDNFSEPCDCEFLIIEEDAGFGWGGKTSKLGVPAEDNDGFERLLSNMDPFGAFEELIDGDDEQEWVPVKAILQDWPMQFFRRHGYKERKKEVPQIKDKPSAHIRHIPAPKDTIYFIRAGNHIKIGITNRLNKRFKSLATGHYEELRLIATIEDAAPGLEQQLHERFAKLRVRGEWFRADPELLKYVEGLGG